MTLQIENNKEPSWSTLLAEEFKKPYFDELMAFIKSERSQHTIYPPPNEVFNALFTTPYNSANVVILGQDPYHGPGQAHGYCFSVRWGVKPPPSLQNIFKELQKDLDIPVSNNGCLTTWAKQGVLLLNTVLTVRAGQAGSHQDRGWESFTDAIIKLLNDRPTPVVFVLWGKQARQKRIFLDESKHTVLEAPHPSPLSAHQGFFGSKPFSKTNEALVRSGLPPIDWRLPINTAASTEAHV